MTPAAALVELLERVGARHGEGVAVGNHELREWPSAAVEEGERQVEIERERWEAQRLRAKGIQEKPSDLSPRLREKPAENQAT